MKETTKLELKMVQKTLVKGENMYELTRRDMKRKKTTEISRILETDKRHIFSPLLQHTKYSEHQFKISLFCCWYVLLTG